MALTQSRPGQAMRALGITGCLSCADAVAERIDDAGKDGEAALEGGAPRHVRAQDASDFINAMSHDCSPCERVLC
jgi:hypothetical protein